VKRGLISVTVLAAALAATGCSGAPSTATSPSASGGSLSLTAGQLAGTWTLTSLAPNGRPDQASPAGAAYTLTFADGQLSIRADCNTCSARFRLSGGTLTTGSALACTQAACRTMEFESAFLRILTGESTVAAARGTLVLSSRRGVLRFTR
jgi:heat shock protein HslJ